MQDSEAGDDDANEYGAAAGPGSRQQQAGQNVGLYGEIGQHNPKKAKAGAWMLAFSLCLGAVC